MLLLVYLEFFYKGLTEEFFLRHLHICVYVYTGNTVQYKQFHATSLDDYRVSERFFEIKLSSQKQLFIVGMFHKYYVTRENAAA